MVAGDELHDKTLDTVPEGVAVVRYPSKSAFRDMIVSADTYGRFREE